MHPINTMNTEKNTLTALRSTFASRRQVKFNLARLAVRKATAMESDYGFTASIPFWVTARSLYDSASRLYVNPTPFETLKVLA